MVGLRDLSDEEAHRRLKAELRRLEKLGAEGQFEVARAFTLMLELMNACENAYRSHRLSRRMAVPRGAAKAGSGPEAIIYVLTAHPTEARSPRNIAVFHRIQSLLIDSLRQPREIQSESPKEVHEADLRHLLEVAWRAQVARERAPRVKDEAEHLYSMLLRDDVLKVLLETGEQEVPVYLRSWVGGDKDGHPGVDEKALLESLQLSRDDLARFFLQRTAMIRETLNLFPSKALGRGLAALDSAAARLRRIGPGDAARVQKLRHELGVFSERYAREVGAIHPELRLLRQLLRVFPGMVVPLSFGSPRTYWSRERIGRSQSIGCWPGSAGSPGAVILAGMPAASSSA